MSFSPTCPICKSKETKPIDVWNLHCQKCGATFPATEGYSNREVPMWKITKESVAI